MHDVVVSEHEGAVVPGDDAAAVMLDVECSVQAEPEVLDRRVHARGALVF